MIASTKETGEGLSVRCKAQLLQINRSSIYYQSQPVSPEAVTLMNEVQDLYTQYPFMGYRRITAMLRNQGYKVNCKRILRVMHLLELRAIYPKKNLSKRRQKDAVFPYLLKEKPPQRPNEAWCVDITYLKLLQGFVYLVALIDVVSRKVMGWSLSPFLETQNCLEAFEKALTIAIPVIINSDQGCQFTSQQWVQTLIRYGIAISMDGKGCWYDNIAIERFWQTIKYEEIYLKCYESIAEARQAIAAYIEFYNSVRPHQALGYKTPNQVYKAGLQ
jgi:putative transposase